MEMAASVVAGGRDSCLLTMMKREAGLLAVNQYFPTAWSDPAFTLLYAAIISLFGEGSRLVIILLLLACFLVSAALVAVTARRLAGPLAGLLALLVLFVMVRGSVVGISAPALAGLWVALLLSLLVAYAERLSLRRAFILGAVLGISVLTWSTTMVFVPVVVLLLFWFAPTPWSAAKMSAATVLTAMLLVAPWTARNYAVFDEFVPVRNGLGHLAHLGTIGLSASFAPERADAPVPAVPLATSGPLDAVAASGAPIRSPARPTAARWQVGRWT
jgi:4-amino-4-deoxy-L-arabinose transferase-like glycosyltransferase